MSSYLATKKLLPEKRQKIPNKHEMRSELIKPMKIKADPKTKYTA